MPARSRMTRQPFDATALASPPSCPLFQRLPTVGVSSCAAVVKLWPPAQRILKSMHCSQDLSNGVEPSPQM